MVNLFHPAPKHIRNPPPQTRPCSTLLPSYQPASPYTKQPPPTSPAKQKGSCPYCSRDHEYVVFPGHIMRLNRKETVKRWVRAKKNQVVDGVIEGWYGGVDWAGRRWK